MSEIDLTGATVLSVEPGDRLVFCLKQEFITRAEVAELIDRLKAALPDVELHVMAGVEVVIKGSDAEPVNDIDATGSCCCNGCIGEGPCDLEIGQSDDGDDDAWEADCPACPSDCQICSDTPHCDCPTHGGGDVNA